MTALLKIFANFEASRVGSRSSPAAQKNMSSAALVKQEHVEEDDGGEAPTGVQDAVWHEPEGEDVAWTEEDWQAWDGWDGAEWVKKEEDDQNAAHPPWWVKTETVEKKEDDKNAAHPWWVKTETAEKKTWAHGGGGSGDGWGTKWGDGWKQERASSASSSSHHGYYVKGGYVDGEGRFHQLPGQSFCLLCFFGKPLQQHTAL